MTDAVIGCDAVDAGAEWLRLKTVSGATRTIPWKSIKCAGTGEQLDGHVNIEGVTEKTVPFRSTHDSVFLVYGDGGLAQLMLEKNSPKRDGILGAFEQHLGDCWRGDRLSESDVMGTLMIPPKVRIPKGIVWAMVVLAVVFFAAMAIVFFVHGAKPTSP